MAINFRGAAGTVQPSGVAGQPVTLPAGIAANDSMWAVASFSGTTQTLTTPAGWTVVDGPVDKGTTLRQYLLSKVAAGTEGGTTVQFTWSATTAKRVVEVIVLSGSHLTTPLHDFASKVETTAGTTHTSPTVTVSTDGCWLVEFIADRASPGSASFTPGAGLALRDTQTDTGGGAISMAVADSSNDVAQGTQGGETWTGTISTANAILWTLAVAPDAAVPVTATPSLISRTVTVNAPTVSAPSPATATPSLISRAVAIQALVATITSTTFPDPISRAVTLPAPTIIASIAAIAAPETVLSGTPTVPTPTIVTTSGAAPIIDVLTLPVTVNPPAIQTGGSSTAPPALITRVVSMPTLLLHVGQTPPIPVITRPVVMILPRINFGTLVALWREWDGASEVVLTVVGVWDGETLLPATNVEVPR